MRSLLLASACLSLFSASPALAQTAAQDTVVGAVAALAPVPQGKLTGDVRPSAYRLDLTLDPARERFSGHVEIDAMLARASSFIDLHGRDLAMHKAVAVVGGRSIPGRFTQLDPTGVARLTFPEVLPAGPVTLAFDYDAAFDDNPLGLFRVKVDGQWYSWSQFESIDARAAFPGFDEPGFKTPFTVTLRTSPGLVAVSNAPEASKTLENGREVHRFAPTLPLPTYLLAMMVGPFTTTDGVVPASPQRATPLPLRIVSTRPNAGKLGFALEGSKAIVAHLEDYFGQAFPFPKLDQITTPIIGGAMENAGADLYGDGNLVLSDASTTGQKRGFGMVVSHELAHQWFGDMVSPAWWDDIWLNESFANWMGFRIGNAWRPDLGIGSGAVAEGFSAMNTDALLAGRPIHQSITRNAQIDEAFDSITYGKGGQVVAMIAAFMGDVKFRDGVRRYMATHRYGTAATSDFFAAVAEAAGDPRIVSAMQSFTDQQGVPLLSFARGPGRQWSVTQSRYAVLGTTAPTTRWGVPLCARQGHARSCSLLTEASAPLRLTGSGPLVPNAGGAGYYRFELPARDWDALIAVTDRLPGNEALAVQDSLEASFKAGRANPAQLIALTAKLVRNPDSYASGAATDAIDGMVNAGYVDAPAAAAWRNWTARLYVPLLARLGFDARLGAYSREASIRSRQRLQIVDKLVGGGAIPVLNTRLADAAQAYLAGKTGALDPAWFGTAFDSYIARGGLPAAKGLIDRGLASEDVLLRAAALDAVATSGKNEIATWLLGDLHDTRLRASERRAQISAIARTPKTRDIGYGWVRAHMDELFGGSNGIFSARLPRMLGSFCSIAKADEFARDLRPLLKGKTGALELERTIERVRNCGVLHDARADELSAALVKLR